MHGSFRTPTSKEIETSWPNATTVYTHQLHAPSLSVGRPERSHLRPSRRHSFLHFPSARTDSISPRHVRRTVWSVVPYANVDRGTISLRIFSNVGAVLPGGKETATGVCRRMCLWVWSFRNCCDPSQTARRREQWIVMMVNQGNWRFPSRDWVKTTNPPCLQG
jgi:hypothetical protein